MTSTAGDLRLVEGADAVWAIARGEKRARLPKTALDADGALQPAVTARLADAGFFRPADKRPYAVTVLPATACNLGCAYCYQNLEQAQDGSPRPPRIPSYNLRGKQIDRVVDFVGRQMATYGYQNSTLLIFGGEPLLNPDGCVALLTAFQRVNLVHADMVTNGTLLTGPLAARLEAAGLRSLQITYDGGEEAHDTIRVARTGAGTFAKINANVREAIAATNLDWSVRVNVSHKNAHTLVPLVEEITAIYPPERTDVYFSPVHDYGVGFSNELTYSEQLAATFIEAGQVLLRNGFSLKYQAMGEDCAYCGVVGGKTGAVINADGRLYSCWTTTGQDGWQVGNIHSGFKPDTDIAERWVSCESDIKSEQSQEQRRRFHDVVDYALLEAERARRRTAVPAAEARQLVAAP